MATTGRTPGAGGDLMPTARNPHIGTHTGTPVKTRASTATGTALEEVPPVRPGPLGTLGGAFRGSDLYTNHRMAGVRPTEVPSTRAARPVVKTGTAGPVPVRDRSTQPIRGDHFTDRNGNVFRNDNGRTEELRNGQWNKVPDQGRTPEAQHGNTRNQTGDPGRRPIVQPADQPRNPQVDQGRTRQPEPAPQQIERERMRGEERVRDFRGYQQERSTAPMRERQPSPTFQAPQRSAPAPAGRSGGGGRRGGR